MRVKWATIPVLVTAENKSGFDVSEHQWRCSLNPVVAGVKQHPILTRDVRVPHWADDRWLQHAVRIEALQLKLPDAVLSHISAMWHYGLPVPSRLSDGHVDLVSEYRSIDRDGVRRRAPHVAATERFYGARIVSRIDMLRQVCGILTESELIVLVDALCGPWHGPAAATVSTLAELSAAWHRVRGVRVLRSALRHARDGVGSPRETWLRRLIVDARLPEPQIGHPVAVHGAIYHPDLSYPELKIAIEYEGNHHLTDRDQWDHDITRERRMRNAGWEYFRVTAATKECEFLADLTQAIEERSRHF